MCVLDCSALKRKRACSNITKLKTDEEVYLLHLKLGHAGKEAIKQLVNEKLAKGVDGKIDKVKFFCDGCASGKLKEKRIPKTSHSERKDFKIFEKIHVDSVPFETLSINKFKGVLVVVDSFSSFTWVVGYKRKTEVAVKLWT